MKNDDFWDVIANGVVGLMVVVAIWLFIVNVMHFAQISDKESKELRSTCEQKLCEGNEKPV